ncbi:hypothetical protein [Sulfurimonas sp.]|jgi:hypothetical protein|uniref:hypothetical protein n=1 Tax=Sulfurimonas sp. TaxID=2022749 RepID=UPI002A36ACB6|nr:hypothetical protein [Sulfurimonas sp.]MDY0122939.1 hypothetical protein [Sulfurimonas sp.]
MQKNRLHQWIESTNMGTTNQEILCINASYNHTQYNLLDLKRVAHSLQSRFKLLWLDGIEDVKYRYYENQIVVIFSQDEKYFEILKKALSRGVIYLDEIESINETIALLCEKRVEVNAELSYKLLQKIEFEEVLHLNQKSLEEFIIARDILLKNIHYQFKGIDFTLLRDYLTIYSNKRVLLANFAQYLYRLATLDFTSTVKSIGTAIHTTLGVPSKIINLKSLKIKIDINLLKNHRVYILNENQHELNIKMDIAKKLIALDIKELDVAKIGNITQLPLKSVEKMHRACFIK